MQKPLLIIISGPPCTGKTTLGRRIANKFHLPFVNKDSIKELLFDQLGWRDREWSKKLGRATYTLLYYFLEILLQTRHSFIVESNFDSSIASQEFAELLKKHGYEPLQILCQTEGATLFQRFKERSGSGERHPGHVDNLMYEEVQPVLLKGKTDPLEIGGTVMLVDTTDFEKIDYEGLYEAMRSLGI